MTILHYVATQGVRCAASGGILFCPPKLISFQSRSLIVSMEALCTFKHAVACPLQTYGRFKLTLARGEQTRFVGCFNWGLEVEQGERQ